MRYPNRAKDFGSKERKVGLTSTGAVMPEKRRTGYAEGGNVSPPGYWGSQIPYGGPSRGLYETESMANMFDTIAHAGYGPRGQAGVFDPAYYLQNNPDLQGIHRQDPYRHYNEFGRNEGRKINALDAAGGTAAGTPAAAVPRSTLAGLTPVGGGGNFDANAQLAQQQATGAATLAQMRGGGPGPAAPPAPTIPQPSFTPGAPGNAPSAVTPGVASFAPATAKNAAASATSPIAAGFALGGPVPPVDPASFIPKPGQEKSRMGVGGRQLRRTGYAEGGGVEDPPRHIVDPRGRKGEGTPVMTYSGGGGEFDETERWRAEKAKQKNYYGFPMPYAEGGEVEKPEDIYVTGDQLAKQVKDRFDQTLQTDEELRHNYDDGGPVGHLPANSSASWDERMRRQKQLAARYSKQQATAGWGDEGPPPAARSLAGRGESISWDEQLRRQDELWAHQRRERMTAPGHSSGGGRGQREAPSSLPPMGPGDTYDEKTGTITQAGYDEDRYPKTRGYARGGSVLPRSVDMDSEDPEIRAAAERRRKRQIEEEEYQLANSSFGGAEALPAYRVGPGGSRTPGGPPANYQEGGEVAADPMEAERLRQAEAARAAEQAREREVAAEAARQAEQARQSASAPEPAAAAPTAPAAPAAPAARTPQPDLAQQAGLGDIGQGLARAPTRTSA